MTDAGGYEFLDDVAIADVCFRVFAPELEALFLQAARATMEVMMSDPDRLRPLETRECMLREDDPEWLLFAFLQDLIYYKDAQRLLLLPEGISIDEGPSHWHLKATLTGETIDPERHDTNADVKAVTLHRFAVRRTETGWEAEVVLDI